MSAQDDLKPDLIFSTPGETDIIGTLSDNGRWSLMKGGLYDISTTPFTRVADVTGADVTDDGNIIVGASGNAPAFYDRSAGSWTLLPLPDGCSGGRLQMVTGNGAFALGTTQRGDARIYVVWNLKDLSFKVAENLPQKDMQNEPIEFSGISTVSPDGRYLLGRIGSQYLLPIHSCSYVVDLETQTYEIIGFKENDRSPYPPNDPNYGDPCWDATFPSLLFIENSVMAPDGMVGGTAYIGEDIEGSYFRNEYRCAFTYNPATKELNVLNGAGQTDMQVFRMANDGMIFSASPAQNPYQFTHIKYGKFYYDLDQVLLQAYGIDLKNYGLSNSGKTLELSGDGRTFLQLYSPDKTYLVRMKEPMADVLARIDLLGNHTVTPEPGSTMTSVGEVQLKFNLDVATNRLNYRNVKISSEDGSFSLSALQGNGLSADGRMLFIRFRTFDMEKGVKYILTIPEGTFWLADDPSIRNKEIKIEYTGRGTDAVKVVSITPAPDSAIPSIDLSDYPLVVYFDSDVKINPSVSSRAYIYSDADDEAFSYLTVMGATSGDRNRVLLAPSGAINLYHGSEYEIVIPEGVVTDISGCGASEEIRIHYTGTYVMDRVEGNTLFESTCDDYSGWLFYEGDHLVPLGEAAALGFNADQFPWMVVRESNESSDMAFGSHSMYYGGGQADDWVATRQIYVPDNSAYLEFDSQSWRKNKQDRLKVIVYERRNAINLLTSGIVDDIRENGKVIYDEIQSPGDDEEKLAGEWRHNVVPLSEYEGKYIYICFLNDNQDQSMVMIDNVKVMRDMKLGLQVTSPSSVVDRQDVEIRGNLTIYHPEAVFTDLNLSLIDGEGNKVSSIQASDLQLREGDVYSFVFPDALPLMAGEENPYSIEASLTASDKELDMTAGVAGAVRNLVFRPERRVVLEEYTGRDCPNCPRGIRMAQLLHERYPDNFIPVAIHTYTGDPKGRNLGDYSAFLQCQLVGAPSGRVNRRIISSPMYWDKNLEKYVESKNDLTTGEEVYLWADEVAAELDEPVFLDIYSSVEGYSGDYINIVSEVRSAINLENKNVRVFGVLLEDGLSDYQENGMYGMADDLLGPWGLGGIYGQGYVFDWTFNHVARGTWGTSFNGSQGLIPATLTAGESYGFGFRIEVPSNVENVYNCHVAVMLIDGNTDRIINAYDCHVANNAVNTIGIDTDGPVEYYDLQGRRVENPERGIYIRRSGSKTEKIIVGQR